MMPGHEDPDVMFIGPAPSFRAEDDPADIDSTSPLPALDADEGEPRDVPRITRLPEGIEVVEQTVGRAEAMWILQVRCECGRRWFEVSPVDTAHCPRCGMYLYVDVAAGGPEG